VSKEEEKAEKALSEVIEALELFESTGDRSKFVEWSKKYGEWLKEKSKELPFSKLNMN
jgi:hypothetical protein